MATEQLIQHCVKHKFLSVLSSGYSQYSLLGRLVKQKIQDQLLLNINTLSNSFFPVENGQLNSELLLKLVDAYSLMGSEVPVTFASSETRGSAPVSGTLSMPQTFFKFQYFVPPSRKIDEFVSMQKRRRHWWKSLLQQPELLIIENTSLEKLNPCLEQRIELSHSGNQVLESISLFKPQVFEDLKLGDELSAKLTTKFQGKQAWPCLMTSEVRLESTFWFFLMDAFHTESVLSLHNSLAPYSVGIILENSEKTKELQDLARLLCLQLGGRNLTVLPPSARWSPAECDARAVPYLIFLQDSTLDQGICLLRNRDTTLRVFFGDRCHSRNMATNCKHEFIVDSQIKSNLIKDKPLTAKGNDDPVQLKPQKISLTNMRAGQVYNISLQFKPAEDYPVDLYFLMDLSNSMEDDKKNLEILSVQLAQALSEITKYYSLGFGSFVDKETKPFVAELVFYA
nr:EOG090X076T [Eurycercus lamellatus]